MLRGTRVIEGQEASDYRNFIENLRQNFLAKGFEEIIFPSLWLQETFVKKAGSEILNQMYDFKDKKGREICLIPEVTALVEEMWKTKWMKEKKKPYKIFYESRCYRYERPQKGRYREFFQFGVEILGGNKEESDKEIKKHADELLNSFNISYVFEPSVKRGLDYYVEDGFEGVCNILGAQKQVLGGGRYESGVGFAVGVDRLLLAKKLEEA